MQKNIIEAGQLPEAEKVYLKKDFLGWRVVEPPTKWFHWIIGSKRNIALLIFILLLSSMFYLGIKQMTSECKKLAENPCNYCIDCFTKDILQLNLSNISIQTTRGIDEKEK